MRSRADALLDLWTSSLPVTLTGYAISDATFPSKIGDLLDIDLPRERDPERPGLADDVLDLLEIALAIQKFKKAVCVGRRNGMCCWDDHGAACPVREAHNRVLDAHAAFETRVTEEQTS